MGHFVKSRSHCSELHRLDHLLLCNDFCNFIKNVFNLSYEVQGNGNVALQNTPFRKLLF